MSEKWVYAHPQWYTQAEADQIRTQAMAENEAAAETVAEAEGYAAEAG